MLLWDWALGTFVVEFFPVGHNYQVGGSYSVVLCSLGPCLQVFCVNFAFGLVLV